MTEFKDGGMFAMSNISYNWHTRVVHPIHDQVWSQTNILPDLRGYLHEDLRPLTLRLRHNRRFTPVGILADIRMQRDVPKELDLMIRTRLLHSLLRAKDVRLAMAVRTPEDRHVLHETQDRHVDLLEHVDALDCVFDSKDMWRCDDDGSWMRVSYV